jgi:hypothetical protein
VSGRQRLLLVGRERVSHALSGLEQAVFTLLQSVYFRFRDFSLLFCCRGELHHQNQPNERHYKNHRSQSPWDNSIIERLRGQIKTIIHWKKFLAESLPAGQLWEKAYTALGSNRKLTRQNAKCVSKRSHKKA